MKPDVRLHPRKVLRCLARLQTGGKTFEGRTVDVSLGGVCMLLDRQLAAGMICSVAFETVLQGKRLQVAGSVKVVYTVLRGTEGFRTGLEFVQIDAVSKQALSTLVASSA